MPRHQPLASRSGTSSSPRSRAIPPLGRHVVLNQQQPSRSNVDVWIDLASIDTGEPDRDAHLRSPEFLDVVQYPRATFKSTSVELSDERAIVHGLLDLHSVVHDLDLEVSLGRTWTDHNGLLRGSYTIHSSLDRQWFGLHWNQDLDVGGVVVGDKVDVATIVAVIKSPDDHGHLEGRANSARRSGRREDPARRAATSRYLTPPEPVARLSQSFPPWRNRRH